ncbi:hypothetical protein [Acidisphaera rubrifaciens]|uniref:hypothetical protein n=1 Tax=Acidisphaera rubrifaciens TaxID=50715 RepID=UPI001F524A0C|nr:hypothetical protein [Acidisphaera rubrifaciens]
MRADLLRHVGGNPTTPQRVLIERAVMLTLNLAKMDAKALATGAMSEHATREYLAWSNTLTRTMVALGLDAAPAPRRDIRDILADRAAGR